MTANNNEKFPKYAELCAERHRLHQQQLAIEARLFEIQYEMIDTVSDQENEGNSK